MAGNGDELSRAANKNREIPLISKISGATEFPANRSELLHRCCTDR
jgi:hypothetical protein